MGLPVLDASGHFLTTGSLQGTPLDWFDLIMALAPGMKQATYLLQITTALVYWQGVAADPTIDGLQALRATWAITWLTAEKVKVTNPPPNNLHPVYPV